MSGSNRSPVGGLTGTAVLILAGLVIFIFVAGWLLAALIKLIMYVVIIGLLVGAAMLLVHRLRARFTGFRR